MRGPFTRFTLIWHVYGPMSSGFHGATRQILHRTLTVFGGYLRKPIWQGSPERKKKKGKSPLTETTPFGPPWFSYSFHGPIPIFSLSYLWNLMKMQVLCLGGISNYFQNAYVQSYLIDDLNWHWHSIQLQITRFTRWDYYGLRDSFPRSWDTNALWLCPYTHLLSGTSPSQCYFESIVVSYW
jgi:hypothetical protein